MKWNKLKAEIPWLLGTLVLAIVLFIGLFGMEGFTRESLELAFHDIYFVFPSLTIFFSLLSLTGLFVFTVRCVKTRFRNSYANLLLILMTVVTLFIYTEFLAIITGWVVYPPGITAAEVSDPASPWLLKGIQYLLILIVVFISIKSTIEIRKQINNPK